MPDPIGRACLVPDLAYESITAVDVTIFRPNPRILDAEYAVQFMNSRPWLHAVSAKASGATRARISRLNLELLKVPVPDIDAQRRIAAENRDLLVAIGAIEASLLAEQEAIDALPAALLRRAFG
jgi:type I restriction enzyme, S subunit